MFFFACFSDFLFDHASQLLSRWKPSSSEDDFLRRETMLTLSDTKGIYLLSRATHACLHRMSIVTSVKERRFYEERPLDAAPHGEK